MLDILEKDVKSGEYAGEGEALRDSAPRAVTVYSCL